jgi:hypothetical protein
MLYHHDNRDYHQAAATAATRARRKLDALIDQGRIRAAKVIDIVQDQQPEDRIARADAINFRDGEDGLTITSGGQHDGIHQHALHQACGRVDLPRSFARHLTDPEHQPWGRELLATNLNELFEKHQPDKRYLLRSVDNEVRGFLSDRYRRLDSRPIVESFAKACGAIGALPVEGYVTDTKLAIKALLPRVYEPLSNEIMAFGVVLENSDFGNGALSLRAFCLRLWCTNFAITDESIRKVHLGARLSDDISWSQSTYDLDTKTMASAVTDVVHGQLAPARIDELQAAIVEANDKQIDPMKVGQHLRKSLSKAEVDQVTSAFNSPDVEHMPAGNTVWRLSNAISWVAGQTEDAERKLDLMKAAGAVLPKAA